MRRCSTNTAAAAARVRLLPRDPPGQYKAFNVHMQLQLQQNRSWC
jgi:hypothetical protein